MTLQASGAISLTNVLNELRIANSGRSGVISLGDGDVLALAGKGSPPISLSDLYGKSIFKATATSEYTSVSSIQAGGTCYSSPYITAIGGSGVITYQWTVLSNLGSATFRFPNNATCQLSRAFSKLSQGSFDVELQCVVADSAGHSITLTGITAHGDWYNNS